MDPESFVYLDVDDVIGVYAEVFGCTDRQAADQLRDRNGLEAAVARPAWYALYRDADLALQAATLAHGMAEGQVFVEGNKRVALAVMLAFLEVNRVRIIASDLDLARWILELSEGLAVGDLASRLRDNLTRIG